MVVLLQESMKEEWYKSSENKVIKWEIFNKIICMNYWNSMMIL